MVYLGNMCVDTLDKGDDDDDDDDDDNNNNKFVYERSTATGKQELHNNCYSQC
jgi:hypothetical protein